jgi:hypothetical protein
MPNFPSEIIVPWSPLEVSSSSMGLVGLWCRRPGTLATRYQGYEPKAYSEMDNEELSPDRDCREDSQTNPSPPPRPIHPPRESGVQSVAAPALTSCFKRGPRLLHVFTRVPPIASCLVYMSYDYRRKCDFAEVHPGRKTALFPHPVLVSLCWTAVD